MKYTKRKNIRQLKRKTLNVKRESECESQRKVEGVDQVERVCVEKVDLACFLKCLVYFAGIDILEN